MAKDRIPVGMQETERRAMGNGGGAAVQRQPEQPQQRHDSKPEFKTTVRADGMKLRQGPELFKFTTPGEVLQGTLVRIDPVEIKGKRVTQYTIANGDATFKILGTYDIDSKLSRHDIERKIEIVYTGDNLEVVRNGNAMKVFDVWVDEGAPIPPARPIESTEITDEDIPF